MVTVMKISEAILAVERNFDHVVSVCDYKVHIERRICAQIRMACQHKALNTRNKPHFGTHSDCIA